VLTAAASENGVVAYWEQTGTDHTQILLTGKKLLVNVTNYGDYAASANVKVATEGSVHLSPLEQTVTLQPGETKTASFFASTPGLDRQVDNIPITVTVHETYGGTEVARTTVYVTLLQTLDLDSTRLIIKAVEKDTGKPAVGVQLTVLYPANGQGEQEQEWTNTKGEAEVTFKVGYNGDISIQAAESESYFAENLLSAVTFGDNEVTIEVEPKNPEEPENSGADWVLPAVASVVLIAAAVGATVFLHKKRTKP
jgi:hypothetical protein